MKKLTSFLIAALGLATLAPVASAHVTLVYPQGGETFTPGTNVTIKWRLLIPHSQKDWDLYFSSDGGQSWVPIASDLPLSTLSYDWIVPEMETTQGRIKVVQDNEGFDYESSCTNFSIVGVATSVDGSASLPESPHLFTGYPNPFTTSTSIEFALPRPARVSLEIFDVLGVKVATLASGSMAAGRHHVTWQPSELATGIYLCRFEAEDHVENMRVVLIN